MNHEQIAGRTDEGESVGRWLWVLLLAMVLKALTPIFFKAAALDMEEFTFVAVASNALYLVSLLIFGLRAIAWQIVLRHLPLSVVYPVSSLSLIMLMITAHFYFGEEISQGQLLGAPFIIVGSVLVASAKRGGDA